MDKRLYHWYLNNTPYLKSEDPRDVLHDLWIKAYSRGYKISSKLVKFDYSHRVEKTKTRKRLFQKYQEDQTGIDNAQQNQVLEQIYINELASLLNNKDQQLFKELLDIEGSGEFQNEINIPKATRYYKIKQFRRVMSKKT